jgi:hypothetical protein
MVAASLQSCLNVAYSSVRPPLISYANAGEQLNVTTIACAYGTIENPIVDMLVD